MKMVMWYVTKPSAIQNYTSNIMTKEKKSGIMCILNECSARI